MFILPADEPNAKALADELANQYALDVFALEEMPVGATLLSPQRMVVYDDAATKFILRELGFGFDTVSRSALNEGADLSEYDIFVNAGLAYSQLDATGMVSLEAFFDGGGEYVGVGPSGAALAEAMDWLDVTTTLYEGNAILQIDYDPSDSIAAGFREHGYGFVNPAITFDDLGAGIEVAARIGAGDDFLVSGFWPGWSTSGAAGQPIIVHGAPDGKDVTLIGIDATFRAHPENSFRIIANSIYDALD